VTFNARGIRRAWCPSKRVKRGNGSQRRFRARAFATCALRPCT
jgi:hypothetical protein